MFISFVMWRFRISKIQKIQLRYVYKQNKLVCNGRALPRIYKDEYCEPTGNFRASITWFQKYLCYVIFCYQFAAKITKNKNRYWVESLPAKKRKLFDLQSHRIIKIMDAKMLDLKFYHPLIIFIINDYPTIKRIMKILYYVVSNTLP